MTTGKEITTEFKGDALVTLAKRLGVDQGKLTSTLKNTIFQPIKVGDSTREATDEEMVVFAVVCNSYNLNPVVKEIYAYPDTKLKRIVPIVSTDGWNRLMTTHPDYENHDYIYSDKMVTMEGAKACPEWMEVQILKKNGKVVKVREYLDEVYRPPFKGQYGPVNGPWQTHTKRMFRHKVKIQGAREAFGFGGIYDQDEAERIIEAEVVVENVNLPGKPQTTAPVARIEATPSDKDNGGTGGEKASISAAGGQAGDDDKPIPAVLTEAARKEHREKLELQAISKYKKDQAAFQDWLVWNYSVDKIEELDDDQLVHALEEIEKVNVTAKDAKSTT